MHIARHTLRLLYPDVRRKHSVELVRQLRGIGNRLLNIKMGHHMPGMNPGIRAACTNDIDRGSKQRRETTFYLALNADAIGLYLPSVIARTVV